MREKDAFPSKYLSSADLKGTEPNVTIERLSSEELNGEPRWVLKFKGKEKTMILNKTNWRRIEHMYGDSDDWIGCRIQLYVEMVDFQGKITEGLRVRRPHDKPADAPEQPRRMAAIAPNGGNKYITKDHGNYKTLEHKQGIAPGQPDQDELPDNEVPF